MDDTEITILYILYTVVSSYHRNITGGCDGHWETWQRY